MTIPQIRLFQLLTLPIIITSQKYYLLYYCAVMYGSLEFLNSRAEYKEQPRYKFYNGLFIIFQLLFCLDRLRTSAFKLNDWVEWQMNSVEHLLFAFIICFKIVQYLNLNFFGSLSLQKRIFITFVCFNALGFVGELFQNSLTENYTLVFCEFTTTFSPDNIKDMQMNLIGSVLFCIAMFFESRKVHL